jgi:hypothetical protein
VGAHFAKTASFFLARGSIFRVAEVSNLRAEEKPVDLDIEGRRF